MPEAHGCADEVMNCRLLQSKLIHTGVGNTICFHCRYYRVQLHRHKKLNSAPTITNSRGQQVEDNGKHQALGRFPITPFVPLRTGQVKRNSNLIVQVFLSTSAVNALIAPKSPPNSSPGMVY
jgi:hypothetical protein